VSIRVHPWSTFPKSGCGFQPQNRSHHRLEADATLSRSLVFLAAVALTLLAACTTVSTSRVSAGSPPPAPREFRAAWVATVANIDWPSRPGLSVAQQRTEMLALLDRARELHLNAIILQVRPAADALYASRLEPWSEYLTGAQGRAPDDPGYDPLREWIAESHRRGLELHAWFNPYRARHSSAKSPLAPTHLANTHPEAVKPYGDLLWMDPAEPAAAKQTLAVIRDVVRRYDVDGVHLDDYFYPYPIKDPGSTATPAANLDFPDDPAWQRYLAADGKLSRAEWRRENINRLVAEIYRSIHAIKPWVRFGVSPFGLGRPELRPPGIAGFSQYDSLYADVELWLQRGWVDYLAPQLYWPIDQKAQAFATLLAYWSAQNTAGRHLWPGLYTSAVISTTKSWKPDELLNQISLVRAHTADAGHIHFSMIALQRDGQGFSTRLRSDLYAAPALVPATPWLRSSAFAPRTPQLARGKNSDGSPALRLTIGTHAWSLRQPPALFAVWKRYGSLWKISVLPAADATIDLAPDPALGAVSSVVVSSIDRLGVESARVTFDLTAP